MDFAFDDTTRELRERLLAFMDEYVYPGRGRVYREQVDDAGDPYFNPPVIEELKVEARTRGLWNLFLPRRTSRRRAHQPRVRAAGRDHGPQPDRARRR